MNKIDLIIECMDQILNDELPSPENMMTAFRYACELKALKPVAWMLPEYGDVISASETDGTGAYNIPLYALNEVTK